MIDLNQRGWRQVYDAAKRMAERLLGDDQWVVVQPLFAGKEPAIFVGNPQTRKGLVLRPSKTIAHHIEVSELVPGAIGKETFKGTHHLQEVF